MEIMKSVRKLCLCCMEEHDIKTVRVQEHNVFKGTEVNYMAVYDYCANADEYIAEEEMISYNDMAMKDAYREMHKLLTSKEIGGIRERYEISQNDLSTILGWGGKTITRYESHQVQDAAHDFILRKIDDDPECFLELLNQGKGRVSEAAYKKYYQIIARAYEDKQDDYLRKAIFAQYAKYLEDVNICGRVKLNLDKVIEVIRYFANSPKMYHLYKVKLMKLLWYADSLSYKRRGFSMTGLVYTALPMGAVPIAHKLLVDLKGVCYEEEEFQEGCGYHFVKNSEEEYLELTNEDKEILDTIIQVCGEDTKEQIVNRMHAEKAYKETVKGNIILFSHALELSID